MLRLAKDGDVIWGTGANGKSLALHHQFKSLDVRAVRGPLTGDFLNTMGIDVPGVFGDPGLLVGSLWSRDELRGTAPVSPVTIIPNLNDVASYDTADDRYWNPQRPLRDCLARIAASRLVIGSSLHAIIVAESLGIPARLVASAHEPPFKYEDYYRGSGRDGYSAAPSVEAALELGGEPAVDWDPQPLLNAFPFDLWRF